MKFIAPELEVKMFNVNDVLTASGEASTPEDDISAATGTLSEGSCVGTSADDWLDDCI